MNYFVIKTSDGKFIDKFNNEETVHITCEGLNSYDKNNSDALRKGAPVFLVWGGDNVPWPLGLAGICIAASDPKEKGYDASSPKNYRLDMEVAIRLPHVMTKTDYIPYPFSYDSFVGPNTKGSRNQALLKINQEQVAGIIRGIIDMFPELEPRMHSFFSQEVMDLAEGTMKLYLPTELAYGTSKHPSAPASEVNEIGQNVLLYGVPGSGKSYYIDSKYGLNEDRMERVVFHPDYTYSDFIGQLVPKSAGSSVSYPFVPGQFTRILARACNDKDHHYYLVIEEINRGNAPAIFGDVFQLLDRDASGKSNYSITNFQIARELHKEEISREGISESEVLEIERRKIRIPQNLSIFATMNTADQSVFTLDTAFKRRWEMVLIPNSVEDCPYANMMILDTGVSWGCFVNTINRIIASNLADSINNEDKRVRAFFIKKEDLEQKDGGYNPRFASKVLLYLWTDVFKYNKEEVFNEKYKTLEEIVQGFEKVRFGVFSVKFGTEEDGEINAGAGV